MLGDGSIHGRPSESNQSARVQSLHLDHVQIGVQLAFYIGHRGEFAQSQPVPHRHGVAAGKAHEPGVEDRPFGVGSGHRIRPVQNVERQSRVGRLLSSAYNIVQE